MLNKDLHRKIMYDILQDIFNSNLWKYLAFKWWTACYFFYGLDRFSTDLDFDLIKDYKNFDEELKEILKKYWKVKIWKYEIKLSYWDENVNIKIDINRKVWKNNSYMINNFYWTDILTQDKKTIFSNKLVALLERNANRDIYDVWFFFKNNFEINDDLIFERTKKTRKELFLEIIKKLEKLGKNYKILDWLWEVLNDEKHKNFVKTKLLQELIWTLKFKVDFE
jgi:predicted nucleotidyltransferase component of viral defense system